MGLRDTAPTPSARGPSPPQVSSRIERALIDRPRTQIAVGLVSELAPVGLLVLLMGSRRWAVHAAERRGTTLRWF